MTWKNSRWAVTTLVLFWWRQTWQTWLHWSKIQNSQFVPQFYTNLPHIWPASRQSSQNWESDFSFKAMPIHSNHRLFHIIPFSCTTSRYIHSNLRIFQTGTFISCQLTSKNGKFSLLYFSILKPCDINLHHRMTISGNIGNTHNLPSSPCFSQKNYVVYIVIPENKCSSPCL